MSRNTLALIGLIAAFVFSAGAFAADPQAVRYYEDAVTRFNSGDLKGAQIQLKNSLTRDPGQLSAKILRGRTYLALGDPQAAAEELVQAQQLGADALLVALPLARARNKLGEYEKNIEQIVPMEFPRTQQPDLWVELGLARLYEADPAGARIAFHEALAIDPTHSGGKVGLARIPLEDKRFGEAERLVDEVISVDPEDSAAWFIKGAAAHATGRFEEAAKAYGRAHQIDPQRLSASIGEAAALLDGGMPARGEALLRSLQPAHPYSPTIPYLLAKALAAMDRPNEAKKALAEAAAIVSQVTPGDIADRPADLLVYGSIAFDNGELEQAYKFLDAYVETGGTDIRGRKTLGRILISMNRPGDALRVLVRLSAKGNADAETLTLLGDANVQLRDFDAARRYYREALTNREGGPAIAQRLAMAQYHGGERDEGLSTMRALVDVLPAEFAADTTLLLGFLYLEEGRLDEAEQMARSLLEHAPQDRTYRNFLATTLANRGQVEEARQIYQQLVAEDPDFRPARSNLVKLDIAQGRYPEASRALDRILSLEPDNTEALYDAGRLARLQGDNRNALKLLEKLGAISPNWIKGIEELIKAHLAEGNPAAALSAATGAYAKFPKDIQTNLLLASVQAANNDIEDARTTLKKASLLAGNDARQLFLVGNHQMRLQAFEDAAWSFTKALAFAPEAVDARLNLAASLLHAKKIAEAEQQVETLRAKHPELVAADTLLADIRQAQGQFGKAIRLYRDVMQRQPAPKVVNSLYSALVRDGRPDDALAVLEQWLADQPDSVLVLNLLAEHHLTKGHPEAAWPIYERLVVLDPDNPQIHNNLATSLSGIDSERALKAALEAYRLSPQNPFVLDTLGWSMVQLGELENGLGYLREARARHGRSPTIRYHLGVALQEFGNRQDALNELRGALQIGGDFPERNDAEELIRNLEFGGG